MKALSAGRVVVINNAMYRNALAVILRLERPKIGTGVLESKTFTVLVIKDKFRPQSAGIEVDSPLPVHMLFVPAVCLSEEKACFCLFCQRTSFNGA